MLPLYRGNRHTKGSTLNFTQEGSDPVGTGGGHGGWGGDLGQRLERIVGATGKQVPWGTRLEHGPHGANGLGVLNDGGVRI